MSSVQVCGNSESEKQKRINESLKTKQLLWSHLSLIGMDGAQSPTAGSHPPPPSKAVRIINECQVRHQRGVLELFERKHRRHYQPQQHLFSLQAFWFLIRRRHCVSGNLLSAPVYIFAPTVRPD